MRLERDIFEHRTLRAWISERHVFGLEDFSMRNRMAVLMLHKDHFILVHVQAVFVMFMRQIAVLVAMEMGVYRTIGVLMQMGMEHFVVPVLCAHRLYPLYRRNKNSGAPRNDVMAPIGRMMGDMIMRATRSDASMMVAPRTRDAGRRNR